VTKWEARNVVKNFHRTDLEVDGEY